MADSRIQEVKAACEALAEAAKKVAGHTSVSASDGFVCSHFVYTDEEWSGMMAWQMDCPQMQSFETFVDEDMEDVD